MGHDDCETQTAFTNAAKRGYVFAVIMTHDKQ